MTDHANDHDDEVPCAPVTAIRAAEQTPETPEQLFERRYQNMRTRQLDNEQAQLNADAAEEIRTLAAHRRDLADDLDDYAPPNPYAKESTR